MAATVTRQDAQDQSAARPAGSGLVKRIISAAVMLPLAIAAVWFGGWFFAFLIFAAGAAMFYEWLRLPGGPTDILLLVIAKLCLAAALTLAMFGEDFIALAMIAAGALLLGLFRPAVFRWSAVGFVYIGLPCLALLWLREYPGNGRLIVFWLLCVVWATDTGAYFAGRSIGGPKLVPRISPNKTWAGLIGGMICAGIVGAAVATLDPALPVAALAAFAAIIAVVSQAGDFTESAIKRHFGVKDASNLIPGHGGALDRLDGLLFAAPVTAMGALLWIGRL